MQPPPNRQYAALFNVNFKCCEGTMQHGLTESDSEESDLPPCGFYQFGQSEDTILCFLSKAKSN